MQSSSSGGPNRRFVLGRLAALPTLPGLLGASAQAQTATEAATGCRFRFFVCGGRRHTADDVPSGE
jgi:hypothetical protein